MPSQAEIRQAITNQIVEALQKGGLPPWRQSWCNDPNCGRAANIVSQRAYRGINPLLLQIASMRHGFKTRWWATYRQWDTLGCHVMRRPENVPPGEWGTTIIFWKPTVVIEKNNAGKEEKKTIFILRTYTVFNLDQVVGDYLNRYRAGFTTLTDEEIGHRFDEAEKVIAATSADIRHGGNEAFYSHAGDYIQMPFPHQFKGADYLEVLGHEMVHNAACRIMPRRMRILVNGA
jgi:antirestriction protein ArdC